MFGGMYDTIDEECQVDCISVGVFFNAARVDQEAALVSYGDCLIGIPSYALYLDGTDLLGMVLDNEAVVSGVSNTIHVRLLSVKQHRTALNPFLCLHCQLHLTLSTRGLTLDSESDVYRRI